MKRKYLEELLDFTVGMELGRGISRTVYEYSPDKTLVLKFERDGSHWFQNVIEWETWCEARAMGKSVARWLAKCHSISADGRWLLMVRTTPLVGKLPRQMPGFLTDFKRENYGMIGRQIVCHDYGTNLAMNRGMSSRGLRTAHWSTD